MDGWNNMLFKPDLAGGIALWEEWQPIDKLIQKKKESLLLQRKFL